MRRPMVRAHQGPLKLKKLNMEGYIYLGEHYDVLNREIGISDKKISIMSFEKDIQNWFVDKPHKS